MQNKVKYETALFPFREERRQI